MTSRSGDDTPPPDNNDELEDFPPRPARTRGDGGSQANLWSDETTDTEQSATPPAEDLWSREPAPSPQATDVNTEIDSPGVTVAVAAETEDGDFISTDQEDTKTAVGGVHVRRVAWELLQTLLLAALIFLMVRGVAQNFRVEGPSMEPGLHNGQYLLVNKAVYFKLDLDKLSKYVPFIDGGDSPSRFLFHGPQRGDVIVFRYPQDPSRDFIKRIIGVPGDTIEISDDVVTVNGVALEEPYINIGPGRDMDAKVVPPNSYFVMGDNRPNSSDSRAWGFVPEENIIGKAMFSYWPTSDFGGVGNTSIDLGFVKIPLF